MIACSKSVMIEALELQRTNAKPNAGSTQQRHILFDQCGGDGQHNRDAALSIRRSAANALSN